ncbi:MAG: hydroxymethylglutaryl-CoA lyase [Crocinitomicaceae bacterium]|nr:hydroxymethylglutaryl-CoA lyase [Crocinitomicaceae bacterium]MDG1777544.1 hydroxymethylglutaryl-CoA lyase [Crocinitomicaceae bacterium]
MSIDDTLKLIECPRDAMQGLHDFIPTDIKVDYINSILSCGFDTVDFGSFVSPKAIPQMKDSAEIIERLNESDSKLLAIVANERGAKDAAAFERIDYLGYPFSVSEQFQLRNTNATLEESFLRVDSIQEIAQKNNKELVIYLSMGFGNPYNEKWHPDIVAGWAEKLYTKLDVKIQALSDTIGCADAALVTSLFETLSSSLNKVEFGAHLHTLPQNAPGLIEAAYNAGCRRFDGAIKGFGGCPMAVDKLTGNMPTELMLDWFTKNDVYTGVDMQRFDKAMSKAVTVFP